MRSCLQYDATSLAAWIKPAYTMHARIIISAIDVTYRTLLLTAICPLTLGRWQIAGKPSSSAQQFAVRRNASSGQELCCLDSPDAILQVRSAVECGARCTQASINCAHFNVKTNQNGVRSCELYPISDACFGQLADCTNYAVRSSTRIFSRTNGRIHQCEFA